MELFIIYGCLGWCWVANARQTFIVHLYRPASLRTHNSFNGRAPHAARERMRTSQSILELLVARVNRERRGPVEGRFRGVPLRKYLNDVGFSGIRSVLVP